MSEECRNRLHDHDHTMPRGYIAESGEADRRLEEGWENPECPDCGFGGWIPPASKDDSGQCLGCGGDGATEVWRDADGAGHWVHSGCLPGASEEK